jgi:hypothetical protein
MQWRGENAATGLSPVQCLRNRRMEKYFYSKGDDGEGSLPVFNVSHHKYREKWDSV